MPVNATEGHQRSWLREILPTKKGSAVLTMKMRRLVGAAPSAMVAAL